jgi:hypothetical protein
LASAAGAFDISEPAMNPIVEQESADRHHTAVRRD